MTLSPEHQSARMSKNYKWRINPVWYRMLYSCTHIATVGVKGLTNQKVLKQLSWVWFKASLNRLHLGWIDWIEQCFTSPPTQYRLYGRRFLQVKRPNQQYQSTEGTNRLHLGHFCLTSHSAHYRPFQRWYYQSLTWPLLNSQTLSDLQWPLTLIPMSHANILQTVLFIDSY